MSGDHNINQFTYGKAILGANQCRPGGFSEAGDSSSNEKLQVYKSQIENQCVEMQCTIDLLKATVETLGKRLAPVMADAPMRTASNDLPPVVSPLGVSIHQYRQQTTAVIDELVHIIESLEI